MNRELIKIQIDALTMAALRKEEVVKRLRKLGGNYGDWEEQAAKEFRRRIAELQGQLDREDNPDEIFF